MSDANEGAGGDSPSDPIRRDRDDPSSWDDLDQYLDSQLGDVSTFDDGRVVVDQSAAGGLPDAMRHGPASPSGSDVWPS